MDITEKVIAITGAGRGLGRAIASAVPARWMASSMLLHILAIWPAPSAPAWNRF